MIFRFQHTTRQASDRQCQGNLPHQSLHYFFMLWKLLNTLSELTTSGSGNLPESGGQSGFVTRQNRQLLPRRQTVKSPLVSRYSPPDSHARHINKKLGDTKRVLILSPGGIKK